MWTSLDWWSIRILGVYALLVLLSPIVVSEMAHFSTRFKVRSSLLPLRMLSQRSPDEWQALPLHRAEAIANWAVQRRSDLELAERERAALVEHENGITPDKAELRLYLYCVEGPQASTSQAELVESRVIGAQDSVLEPVLKALCELRSEPLDRAQTVVRRHLYSAELRLFWVGLRGSAPIYRRILRHIDDADSTAKRKIGASALMLLLFVIAVGAVLEVRIPASGRFLSGITMMILLASTLVYSAKPLVHAFLADRTAAGSPSKVERRRRAALLIACAVIPPILAVGLSFLPSRPVTYSSESIFPRLISEAIPWVAVLLIVALVAQPFLDLRRAWRLKESRRYSSIFRALAIACLIGPVLSLMAAVAGVMAFSGEGEPTDEIELVVPDVVLEAVAWFVFLGTAVFGACWMVALEIERRARLTRYRSVGLQPERHLHPAAIILVWFISTGGLIAGVELIPDDDTAGWYEVLSVLAGLLSFFGLVVALVLSFRNWWRIQEQDKRLAAIARTYESEPELRLTDLDGHVDEVVHRPGAEGDSQRD